MPAKMNITNQYAINCKVYHGPIFGSGLDIHINGNMRSNSNYSNFGFNYKLENYPNGSQKAKCFSTGGEYFIVEEIEVFKLI